MCAALMAQQGVSFLVRFAHEMNGACARLAPSQWWEPVVG